MEQAFEWGSAVVEDRANGYPLRVYSPRRTHLIGFFEDTRKWPEREYLVQGERRIAFAEHEQRVARLAMHFRELGLSQGDRVLLLGANSIEWVVAYWATLAVGAVVVSGNAWWSRDEVAHAVLLTEPKLAVVDDRRLAVLPEHLNHITMDAVRRETEVAHDTPELQAPVHDENDPAVILFTSGTTGAPKGAVLSHRSQIAHQQNQLVRLGVLPHKLTESSPRTVTLASSPLFHVAGIMAIMGSMLTGSCIVMNEGRYDVGQILDLIKTEQVTRWGAVPTMLVRLLNSPQLATADTSSLKQVLIGGATIPDDLPGRLREAIPTVKKGVGAIYGMSEAGGLISSIGGEELLAHPGSVGRPYPVVEVRIESAGQDGCGEIVVRTPTAMSGYIGRPNDSTLDGDGWLRTGDMGRLDADGYLYLTGRCKDIVIRGGENVSAPHVEACLLKFPDIHEAAVVALEHPDWGEEVAAVLVPKSGCTLNIEEIERHCRQSLAHFEVPSQWWVRDELLPTNDAGKVAKPTIRANWPKPSDQGEVYVRQG